jgi:hypothetical protein
MLCINKININIVIYHHQSQRQMHVYEIIFVLQILHKNNLNKNCIFFKCLSPPKTQCITLHKPSAVLTSEVHMSTMLVLRMTELDGEKLGVNLMLRTNFLQILSSHMLLEGSYTYSHAGHTCTHHAKSLTSFTKKKKGN